MAHTYPSISVILPFSNAEKTLGEAVQSILNQSFSDIELLLIDNKAVDQSTKIAKDLAQKDKRIRYIAEPKLGIVHALNTALVHAKAKYIARMDADDISYPNRLQIQYQFLKQNPSVDVVSCRVEVDEDENTLGLQAYVEWSNQLITHQDMFLNRFIDSPLIHPTVMFKQSLITKYGGYQDGDFPEDFELWLRWLEQGVQFYKIPQNLFYWRDSLERLTRSDTRYSSEAFYPTKSKYLAQWLQKHNPFYPEVVIWGAGRKSRQRAQMLEEKGIRIVAYIDIVPDKTSAKPCIYYQDIPGPGEYFILSYVSNRGQGSKIRAFLIQKAYREGVDFLMVS